MDVTTARIGFIGLGNMGLPMALRLHSAGFDVLAYDTNTAAMAQWSETSGKPACFPGERASDFDFLITMLPDGKKVRDAITGGEQPLLQQLKPGCILIDMSSSSPADTLDLKRIVQALGLTLVDAPVSGGVPAAAEGSLTIMVGSDDADCLKRSKLLLGTLGTSIIHVGPVGAGHAAKALNNAVAAAIFEATSEALVLGEYFGLEQENMITALNAATGGSRISQHLFPGQVLNGRFSQGFKLALMAKDTAIAAEMAVTSGCRAVLLTTTAQQWRNASQELPSADFSEMHKFISSFARRTL